jgi:hypothetical protein
VEILIHHLTRMQPGFICVAGIDRSTGQHVRPVVAGARLSTVLLARHGGPFDMGAVVELGTTRAIGGPPEVEDYSFEAWHAKRMDYASPDEIWRRVRGMARTSLAEIFGPALHLHSRGSVVDAGQGSASLGCFIPSGMPQLRLEAFGAERKLRMQLTDGELGGNVSVTDLRLFEDDHITPRATKVDEVNQRLRDGVGVVLCVGLTRPFASSADTAPYHWLQVNNLHLEDDPGWRLE